MWVLSFTISMGGCGKSLLLACTAAQMAMDGYDVTVIDDAADPQIGRMYGLSREDVENDLFSVVQKDLDISTAIYETGIRNLKYIRSGIPLKEYLNINPIRFVEKISQVDTDYLFVDMRHPIGPAAILSLGISHYYVLGPLRADNLRRAVDEAIDTLDQGVVLRAVPLGFVINQPQPPEKDISDEFVQRLESFFGLECLAVINYDEKLLSVFEKGILPIKEWPDSEFSKSIKAIAQRIEDEEGRPEPKKKDILEFIRSRIIFVRE